MLQKNIKDNFVQRMSSYLEKNTLSSDVKQELKFQMEELLKALSGIRPEEVSRTCAAVASLCMLIEKSHGDGDAYVPQPTMRILVERNGGKLKRTTLESEDTYPYEDDSDLECIFCRLCGTELLVIVENPIEGNDLESGTIAEDVCEDIGWHFGSEGPICPTC